MTSLFRSCFPPDRAPARVLHVTVDCTTDALSTDQGVSAVRSVSPRFVEAVLLYHLGAVRSMGFVREPEPTRFVVRWADLVSFAEYWAELNLRAMTFQTNAEGVARLQGFGLVGIGAALVQPASGLREAWCALLTHLQTVQGTAALSTASVGPIAHSIAAGLVALDTTKDSTGATGHEEAGDGWTLVDTRPHEPPVDVDDVKHRLLTIDDFLELLEHVGRETVTPSRFQGPQLPLLRGLIRRRKHTVLLGPAGVGKTLCAFEALALEQCAAKGVDYQLFMGHDDVKAADLLGAWQPTASPGLFLWVPGPLVRAMTAHEGKGQPILVEEFLRMPRRSQNVLVTALSDGYVVLNEKPDEYGKGEVVQAGPDFVFLADMNIDAAADDLELYGAAFASRVRKLVYGYPSAEAMLHILAEALPRTTPAIRTAVVGCYTRVLGRFESADVTCPISPRACIHWCEELLAALPTPNLLADSLQVRTAAGAAAETTWLTDVAGFTATNQKPLLDDIEAQFRKAFGIRPSTTSRPS